MEVFDKFFQQYAYKFDKGYPDMNNAQDVLLLETLLSEVLGEGFSLIKEATPLTKRELEKDATFSGGRKVPRVEILIDKITQEDKLELIDGTTFVVDNKDEVIRALKNEIPRAGITLIDKEGNKISTSKLAKTSDFGGGGGSRGGSDITTAAENAQCIANAIRYSLGSNITSEDITEKNIESSKNKVDGDGFEEGKKLLLTDSDWINSSVNIANELASKYSGPFIQNRGSAWVKNLEASVKPFLKSVGIRDINKWNPADIWMVSPDEMSIEWPDNLGEINALLLEKYNNGKIIGVSLKKAEKSAKLKVTNLQKPEAVEYEGIAVAPRNAKAFIKFSDGGSMEFRNFGGDTSFMGELEGTGAAAGKVGYGYIKSILDKYGIEVSNPQTIRQEASKEDANFKSKFKKLWDETEGLEPSDFEPNYNARPTPKSNQAWRISKYLALELVNAVDKSKNRSKVIDAFNRYASSQGDESSVFVKAS